MRRCDVAIAGAGPAGTSAAILLARAGLSVRLVAAVVPRAPTIEGASPRVAALLSRFGLAAEGLAPAVPRRAEWGALPAAPNREHPVDRARFDAALLAQAADEGVEVVRAAVARLDPAGGVLTLADGRIVAAGRLVEARGRRAPAADGRCRGPATLAIVAPDADPVRDGTRLRARAAGWTWRAGQPDGRGVVQVVTDPAGRGREGLAVAWARVTGDPLPDGATATAAEMRLTAPDLDPACLRLGDAAIAIDPLSGHGLFWALSSALMLPPILAALEAGEVSLARRFWRDRAAATFWRQARVGRDLHRMAGLSGPFWEARAAWPDDAPAHAEVARPALRRKFGDAFPDHGGKIGFDHRIAGDRIMQALNDRPFKRGIEGDDGQAGVRRADAANDQRAKIGAHPLDQPVMFLRLLHRARQAGQDRQGVADGDAILQQRA